MGQKRPCKAKPDLGELFEPEYSLYKGIKDRSNLELLHSRCVAWATTFYQRAVSIALIWLALISILISFLLFRPDVQPTIIFMCILLSLSLFYPITKFYIWSRGYSIKAEFIEIKLGIEYTWKKYGFKEKYNQFLEEKDKKSKIMRLYIFLGKMKSIFQQLFLKMAG